MEDYEKEQTDFDMDTPEDRSVYDRRYITKLKELTGKMDSEDTDEVISELQGMNYNPSNSPENDCELNYLKTKNVIRQKSKLNPSVASYLQFLATESGKPLSEVKRNYRKITKKGGK